MYISHTLTALTIFANGSVGIKPRISSQSQSGQDRMPKVNGGRIARPNEFPYMAAIFTRIGDSPVFGFTCGGSIYNENYTITAGHCLLKRDGSRTAPADVRVVVGANQVKVRIREDAKELIPVNDTVVHQGMDASPLLYILNDIAMIKLAHPLLYSKTVRKLRVASPGENPNNGIGELSGWGRTERYFPLQRPPSGDSGLFPTLELKTARLRILPNSICAIRHFTIIPSTVMCVGSEGLLDSQSACFGDSGGPLACAGPSGSYLCGLVSTGLGCGLRFTPGYYTAVNEYATWIRRIGGAQ